MSLVAELRRRNVFRVVAAYTVAGWLLTEVLTAVLPALGAPLWAPRAVILIFAFGFIPAAVFSWFYELTAEGIKREADIDRPDDERSAVSRATDYAAVIGVIALIVVAGLFSARHSIDDTTPKVTAASAASVAVLPFLNLSDDKDNEYFSDGLTETLLHMLAQIPNLEVAARTSSFAFKGQNLGIREIAAALGVANILEGSVQRDGDRVRITAQLIRASDGFHVWSNSYDRRFENIFEIQDEIASRVGFALSETLIGGARHPAGVQTSDPDAYDLYLQARRERATFSYGGLQAAEDLLKGALLIDPQFVEAKTELASSYIHQMETGLRDVHQTTAEVMAITGQVLEADPENVVARALRTYVSALEEADHGNPGAMREASVSLRSLVDEDPRDFGTRILLVRAYQNLSEPENAVPLLEQAAKLDPFNPQVHYELGSLYVQLQRFGDARRALEKSLEIEPAQPNAYVYVAQLSLQEGDAVSFVQSYLKALEIDPRDHELPGMMARFLYELGLVEEGDDFRSRVMTIAPTSEVAYQIELLRAIARGDHDAAIASARRIIIDDVPDRRFAWGVAVQYLLRAAIRDGSVESELTWIEQRVPNVFEIEAATVPAKHRTAQGIAFDAWYVMLPREDLLARLDAIIAIGTEQGFDYTDDPYTHVNVLAMRGQVQEAVRVALDEYFSRPVALNLNWRDNFSQAQFAAVVADPRIQAAMQRWEDEEAALRDQVRGYLADLQANS